MDMHNELEARTALVTGASRGIGCAIALKLGACGARVIGTATTREGAEGIRATLGEAGIEGVGVALDLAADGATTALAAELKTQDAVPDILVNNAGITRDGLLPRMSEEDWDAVIEVNLKSAYRLSKLCLRSMIRAKWGRIINVTSVSGLMGNPGQSNYAAAKAGIGGFTRSLAREVASRGITVNCVAPGFIDTDMTRALPAEQRAALGGQIPAGRFGAPEEIAHVVAMLASPGGGYITGETICVSGGLYMR